MENVEIYLEKWSLTNAELIAKTQTSHLYKVKRVGDVVVLKIFTELGSVDEAGGAVALKIFDGKGAVKLLESDDKAQLLEYISGPDLTKLVKEDSDEEATEHISNILNTLHSSSPAIKPQGLVTLEERFASLFEKSEQDEKIGINSIYKKGANIARKLLDSPLSVSILHGDIHHENIRQHKKRGWLAIDPKGLWGERTYDAANTLCNPLKMPALVHNKKRLFRNAEILANALKVDIERMHLFVFAHALLTAAWSIEDGQDPNYFLRIAEIIESEIS